MRLAHAIQSVCPEDAVRDGTSRDAIDNLQPKWVAEPASIEQLSDVMQRAHEHRMAVAPRGSGTSMHIGNIPQHLDGIVSLCRMNSLLEHSAGDLVVRVQAGMQLRALNDALKPHGQWLALDPPHERATIGGVIATDAYGPHRLRYGAVRDLLIGVTYVMADGTVAIAGGKVVKNVAGYDLCKLFTGSLGTLCVVAEAIFRLHPLPQTRRSVTLEAIHDELSLHSAVQKVLHSYLTPTDMDFVWNNDQHTLIVGFEGIERSVEVQAESASSLLQSYGTVTSRTRDDVAKRETDGDGTTRIKTTAPIAALPAILTAVARVSQTCGLRWSSHGHAGIGITYTHLEGDADRILQAIQSLRAEFTSLGAHVVTERIALELKQALDVWGTYSEAEPLMHKVKDLFDPDRVLNPGRFVGGL